MGVTAEFAFPQVWLFPTHVRIIISLVGVSVVLLFIWVPWTKAVVAEVTKVPVTPPPAGAQSAAATGDNARAIIVNGNYTEAVDTSELKKKVDDLQASINATFQAQEKLISDAYPAGYGVCTITKSREIRPIKASSGSLSLDWSTAAITGMSEQYILFMPPSGMMYGGKTDTGDLNLAHVRNQIAIPRQARKKATIVRFNDLIIEAEIFVTTNDGDMLVIGGRPITDEEKKSGFGAMINFQPGKPKKQ